MATAERKNYLVRPEGQHDYFPQTYVRAVPDVFVEKIETPSYVRKVAAIWRGQDEGKAQHRSA